MSLPRVIVLCCVPILSFHAIGAGPSLEFASTDRGEYTGARAFALPSGNTLLIGSTFQKAQIYSAIVGESVLVPTVDIQMLNAQGVHVSGPALNWGSGSTSPTDAAIDSKGDIWLVGYTDSDDFPLLNPIYASKASYAQAGFLAELDPTASQLLFSTFLGGSTSAGSVATGIALDSSGNVFVTGATAYDAFAASLPVLGTPSSAHAASPVYTFVAKIASPAGQLVWSVLFGGSADPCTGEESCLTSAFTSASAIAVDASDNITLGGSTNVSDLPPAVSAVSVPSVPGETVAFIVRVAADGGSLLWGTYIGSPQSVAGGIQTFALALDASANVFAAGTAFAPFPTTAGAFDSAFPGDLGHLPDPAVWAAEISSDGSTLVYGTYLTGADRGQLGGLVLDASANVWITGLNSLPDNPDIGVTFALELNANGSAVTRQYGLALSDAIAPPFFDDAGNLMIFYPSGSLLRLSPSADSSVPVLYAITNAAKLTIDPGVAPGELATIWGPNIGPAAGSEGAPDSQGLFPVTLGGVQVLFQTANGAAVAAPLLYVGAGQINLQVPYEFQGGTMQVITPSLSLPPMPVPVIQSVGIFRSGAATQYAAALNQDLSVNSASNPAAIGSIAVLYVTGLSGMGAPVTGAVSAAAASFDGVSITADGVPLNILYAGPAPGLISGVCQINVQLPPNDVDPGLTLIQPGQVSEFQLPPLSSAEDTVEVYAN